MSQPPRRRETLRDVITKHQPDLTAEQLEELRREFGDLDQPVYSFKDILRAIGEEDDEK